MSAVDGLAGAGETVAGFLDQLEPGAAERPTPCGDWDVRAVTAHLVAGNIMATAILRGVPVPDLTVDHLGNDWAGAMRASVADLVSAFSAPEVATSLYQAPVGELPGPAFLLVRTVEQTVHGWDIARGLGVDPGGLDPVAGGLYPPTQQLLTRLPELAHRRPFAESVEVADDASPVDRLAALLGRNPAG